MNTLLALLAVLFHIADPASDAIGDGTLTPPTAPLYASSAVFDIRELTLHATDDGELTVVLEMATLERDGDYENGFRSLIADVYLDTAPGGENMLNTPGEWLLEPDETWNYLVRITPDGTYGLAPDMELVDADELVTTVHESQIIVALPSTLLAAEEYEPYAYALTGLYDPFAANLWREVESAPSPWAFSSDAALPTPVLDITAADFDIQAKAFENRVLPKEHVTVSRSLIWIAVMFAGLLIAIVGWLLRLQKRPAAAVTDAASDADVNEDQPTEADVAPAPPARKLELLAPVRPKDSESEDVSENAVEAGTPEDTPADKAPESEPAEPAEPTELADEEDEEIVIPFVERRG